MGVAIPGGGFVEDRASGALVVDGGLRFDSGKSNALTRTPSSVGNKTTFTWSGWVKRNIISVRQYIFSATSGGNSDAIYFHEDNTLRFHLDDGLDGALVTTQLFRDPSAWYHLLWSVDFTQATSTNRVKLYVNGTQITAFSTSTYPSQNYANGDINNTVAHAVGRRQISSPDYYLSAQLSNAYLIDGQALDASYFGYTDALTNTWRPKKFKPQATPNDGTVWSSGTVTNTGSGIYSGSWANVFDGDFSSANNNWVYVYSNSTTRLTFPKALSGLIEIYGSNGSGVSTDSAGTDTIVLSDSSTYDVSAITTSNAVWYSFGQKTGITYIDVKHNAGSGQGTVLRSIRVNGVPLLDSDTTNMGANAFYLPFDGSAPIGQDQSGRGNNWTPVNFGGSNTLEKATGALPILNTDGGGKVARVGVFGSQVGAYYAVTVPGGTGGGFYLDGVQEPTLSFIRGATYTFDQSAASNSGHPLLFSTTQDGTTYSDGVTTSGTPGSSGAFTKITVPHNSADTLYYKCGNHSGMGASISVTTDEKKSDLYAWKNILALPFVGGKDDISNAVNSGSTTKTITNTSVTFTSSYSNLYDGSSSFNGTSSKLTTTATSDFLFGTGDFTVEGWFYLTTSRDYPFILEIGAHAGADGIAFMVNDRTYGTCLYSGGFYGHATVFSQLNKWNHIAWVRRSGVLYIYENGVLGVSAAFTNNLTNTTNNVIIGTTHSGASNYFYQGYIQDYRIYKGLAKYTQNFIPASTDPDILPDTPSGVSYTSNLTQITDGAVAFQGTSGAAAATNYLNAGTSSDFTIGTGDNFTFEAYINPSSVSDTSVFGIGSSTIFAYRIISGSPYLYIQASGGVLNTGTIAANKWTHIAITRNSGTLYSFIDGVLAGSVANTSSFDAATGTGAGTFIGAANLTGVTPPNYSFTGQISNVHFVKGTALYTSNFTPPTGPISSVANTKLLCCKSNSSATAFDVSPGSITANGNAAATNFNPFTVNINTQRGKQSGWATWNPLEPTVGTLSNGNLLMVGSSAWKSTKGTVSVSSGKWYYEGVVQGNTFGTATGNLGGGIGWYTTKNPSYNVDASTSSLYANLLGFHNTGQYNNFSTIQTSTGSMTAGDVIGVALNKDSNTFAFYKNGVSIVSGSLANTTDDLTPWTNAYYSSDSTWVCNFGQKPFKFPPPAGFQPLALANTPRPTIVRPDQFVGVSTWSGAQSGSGGLTRQINTTFQPDFVWIKQRNQAYSTGHQLYDSVRGAGAEKELNSSGTGAEGAGNIETYGWLNSFDKTGFTVKGGSSDYDYVDKSGVTYVGWAWKAGGNSNTFNINDVGYATASAAGLTAGTITPTGASVNTKSGFSIITYNGAGTNSALTNTISHGLTQAPTFMIVKARTGTNAADDWFVYHKSIGPTKRIRLNLTNAADTQTWMGDTEPTSSLITLNQGWYSVNYTGHTHILYAWHDVPGFSKFGTYTGNASTDGPFVFTGFRPRWLLVKETGNSNNWFLLDSTRNQYNYVGNTLWPNLSNQENDTSINPDTTYNNFDFLSNGFKPRSTYSGTNRSGGTYIYAAFAETPTQNLYGAQSNAR